MAKPPKRTSVGFNAQVKISLPPNSYDYDHDNRPEISVFLFENIRAMSDSQPLKAIFLDGGHVLYLHDFDAYTDCVRPANAEGLKLASRHMLVASTSPLRYMRVSGYSIKNLADLSDAEWTALDKPRLKTDFKCGEIDYEGAISIIKLTDAGPVPNFAQSRPQFFH